MWQLDVSAWPVDNVTEAWTEICVLCIALIRWVRRPAALMYVGCCRHGYLYCISMHQLGVNTASIFITRYWLVKERGKSIHFISYFNQIDCNEIDYSDVGEAFAIWFVTFARLPYFLCTWITSILTWEGRRGLRFDFCHYLVRGGSRFVTLVCFRVYILTTRTHHSPNIDLFVRSCRALGT